MVEVSKIETAFVNFGRWVRSLFRRKESADEAMSNLEKLISEGQAKLQPSKGWDPPEASEAWFKKAKLRRPAPPASIPQPLSYRALMKRCAECNGKAFWMQGPTGGMSINIFCGHCGQGYNVSPPLEHVEKISKNIRYIQKGGIPDARRR